MARADKVARAQKRGGGVPHVSLADGPPAPWARGPDLVALDDALDALAAFDARKAKVMELRDFGGLSVDKTAEALHVSPETGMRDWKMARLWLLRELRRGEEAGPTGH